MDRRQGLSVVFEAGEGNGGARAVSGPRASLAGSPALVAATTSQGEAP